MEQRPRAATPARRWRMDLALMVMLLTVVLAACDTPPIDLGGGIPAAPSTPPGDADPAEEVTASEVPADPPADSDSPSEVPSDTGEATDDAPDAQASEDGLAGFATVDGGTTGGGGGDTVIVSDADELTAAISAEGPAVVQVTGTIELSGMHPVASDKTIEGVGGTISGGGLTLRGASNVIVRNLTFTGADDDAINIEESSTHIWIDHNDFSDAADGLVDIKRGSDFITVSWNHFHDHDKTALLGHSDDNAAQDEGHLRVTYHHNWFDGTNQRHPRARFGDPVHVYNNYFDNVGSYGIASTMGAGVVAEGNYFAGVDAPIVTQTGDSDEGNVVERDNVYDGSGEPQTRGTATEPSAFYNYTLDDAGSIPSIVTGGAGTR